jgi:hypothetical protein
MSRARILLSVLALSAVIAVPAAQAQQRPPAGQPAQAQQPAPPRPYKQVPVTLPAPNTDPSFVAFRKQLADIAERKDRMALAGIVVANNFFWIGPKGDQADKRKSGIDNLAAALNLADSSGWQDLADYADDPTLEPVPQRRGVSCAPARATFDVKAAEQLSTETKSYFNDWAYPVKPGVEVRAAANAGAAVIDKLGMYLVRVFHESAAAGQESSFLRIVTPAGKVGFVQEDDLESLDDDHICYIKDASGWKIAGYFGASE